MKFELFGIPITICGEADTNDKLERYHELNQNAETETYEEWLDHAGESMELYEELRDEGVIVIEDEPNDRPWWKLW